MNEAPALAGDRRAALGPAPLSVLARVGAWTELTKPRITMLVVLTALAGFFLAAAGGPLDLGVLLHTLVGTALACSGASALNQVLEREPDGRMRRTSGRPLPSGRLSVAEALSVGATVAAAGVIYLAALVNLPAALLALFTQTWYLLVYTPLKRVTVLCTLVGAVSGAVPPMIGWAGAAGGLSAGAWALFLIQFLWQMPHFFSIAWLYQDDYARGGYRMLPLVDPSGRRTGFESVLWSALLLVAGGAPWFLGLTGAWALVGSLLLGSLFVLAAVSFARSPGRSSARRLLLASVTYLPLLLALLMLDRAA